MRYDSIFYNKFFFLFFLDFNGDGKPDNITFMIKRIKVHNQNALKDPSYRFPGNYGVEKFLELFSGKFSWDFFFCLLCGDAQNKHLISINRHAIRHAIHHISYSFGISWKWV